MLLSIQADINCSNDRIDRFLKNAFQDKNKTLSRSRIKTLILDKRLTENGNILVDPSASVKTGATYVLTVPPAINAIPKAEKLPLDILYEDKHLLVINKPVGLVVHPAPGSMTGTLVNALIHHCGRESPHGIGGVLRPGIVHRLDKDTSGVMIAAKTGEAHANLTKMFASHDIDRRYHALLWGINTNKSGTINAPIGRSNINRKKTSGDYQGTRSNYTLEGTTKSFPPLCHPDRMLIRNWRTHQIRVHMAHVGNSIIGDKLYGRFPRHRQMPDAKSRNSLEQLKSFLIGRLYTPHILVFPIPLQARF